jgi:hypothetical protein
MRGPAIMLLAGITLFACSSEGSGLSPRSGVTDATGGQHRERESPHKEPVRRRLVLYEDSTADVELSQTLSNKGSYCVRLVYGSSESTKCVAREHQGVVAEHLRRGVFDPLLDHGNDTELGSILGIAPISKGSVEIRRRGEIIRSFDLYPSLWQVGFGAFGGTFLSGPEPLLVVLRDADGDEVARYPPRGSP